VVSIGETLTGRPALRRQGVRWPGLRAAPLTAGYLIVLTATTALISFASTDRDDRLLLAFSTNLHQLAHVPLRVIVGSAFWTDGWGELASWLVLFTVVVAPVERRLGWRRTLLVFAAGHVGATLIVAAGLTIAVHTGATDPSVAFSRDVGVSYGFFAVAALAGYLLRPPARVCYLATLLAYVLLAVTVTHDFTDFGHLTAVAIGLACYPVARGPAHGAHEVEPAL
jgi:hypothetical protein